MAAAADVLAEFVVTLQRRSPLGARDLCEDGFRGAPRWESNPWPTFDRVPRPLLRWITTYGQDVISLRPAVGGDAAVATSLVRAAYQPYVSRIGRLPAPVEADYEELASSGDMWIAEDDDQVVGVIILEDADDHLLLDNIAVSPPARGSGVGSRLLAFAQDEATRRGFDRVCLYTDEKRLRRRAAVRLPVRRHRPSRSRHWPVETA
jgi:GNAT superfamily N-acetyltransferase